MKKHEEGEIVVNKKKLLRVQSFRVMLRFWIKPMHEFGCMVWEHEKA
jgi:hypothetical protein